MRIWISENSGKQLVNTVGSRGMLIRNGVMGGVYLKPGHMRISTEEQLTGRVYRYCYTRYKDIRDCRHMVRVIMKNCDYFPYDMGDLICRRS
ncbi:MAG: hypothetical protein ACLTDF_04125 [Coprococcus sp.]